MVTPALVARSLGLLVAIGGHILAMLANPAPHTVSESDRAPIGPGSGVVAKPWV